MKIYLELDVETIHDNKATAGAIFTQINDGIQSNIPDDMAIEIVAAKVSIPVMITEEHDLLIVEPIEEVLEDTDENQY